MLAGYGQVQQTTVHPMDWDRNKMIGLETLVDPLAFDDWIQVAALAILALTGLAWRYLSVINSNAKATSEVVSKIDASLSTNNGGSHVKDSLDRLEEVNAEIIKHQAEIKATQAEHGATLATHVQWSDGFAAEQKEMHDKLDEALECQKEKLATIWKTVSPSTPE